MFKVISVFWHWWIIALGLMTLELLAPGTFFLWMGISAFIIGLLAWVFPTLSLELQLILFSIFSIAAAVSWKIYQKRKLGRSSDNISPPRLNERASHYVGRIFTLESAIVNGQGRVRVDDSIWRVQGPDLPKGAQVRVITVDGPILIVEDHKV